MNRGIRIDYKLYNNYISGCFSEIDIFSEFTLTISYKSPGGVSNG